MALVDGNLTEAGFAGHRRQIEQEHPLEQDLLSMGIGVLPEYLQRWKHAKVKCYRGRTRFPSFLSCGFAVLGYCIVFIHNCKLVTSFVYYLYVARVHRLSNCFRRMDEQHLIALPTFPSVWSRPRFWAVPLIAPRKEYSAAFFFLNSLLLLFVFEQDAFDHIDSERVLMVLESGERGAVVDPGSGCEGRIDRREIQLLLADAGEIMTTLRVKGLDNGQVFWAKFKLFPGVLRQNYLQHENEIPSAVSFSILYAGDFRSLWKFFEAVELFFRAKALMPFTDFESTPKNSELFPL